LSKQLKINKEGGEMSKRYFIPLELTAIQEAQLRISLKNDYVDNSPEACRTIMQILKRIERARVSNDRRIEIIK